MNKVTKGMILFIAQVLSFVIIYELGFYLLAEHFFEVKQNVAWGLNVLYAYIIFSIIAFIGFLYRIKVDRYDLLLCLIQFLIFVLFFYKSFSLHPFRLTYLFVVALSVFIFFSLIWQCTKRVGRAK